MVRGAMERSTNGLEMASARTCGVGECVAVNVGEVSAGVRDTTAAVGVAVAVLTVLVGVMDGVSPARAVVVVNALGSLGTFGIAVGCPSFDGGWSACGVGVGDSSGDADKAGASWRPNHHRAQATVTTTRVVRQCLL